MESLELEVTTRGRVVSDLTIEIARFAAAQGGDGLLHVFLPHATAGLALIETGAGSERDLEDLIERVLPRDDRYAHRHGSIGHGADHVVPAIVAPALVLAVVDGTPVLGTWQSVVLVDPNRDNHVRRVRLSFLSG